MQRCKKNGKLLQKIDVTFEDLDKNIKLLGKCNLPN